MRKKNWHVIGLMSGTSLDGIDLVYVKISRDMVYDFVVLEKKSIKYSELWKKTLQEAFEYSNENLTQIDLDYGKYLGEVVKEFVVEFQLEEIDFIASHGHTIFHKPDENFTLQIGSGKEISNGTQLKVICDFRSQDVRLGGQGAPLVPIGDMLLFGDYDFCLNLGGFANVSFQRDENRIAFDICPANIVLNHYTRKIGMEFDDKGNMASDGSIHNELLNDLNQLPFYNEDQPKSLGYEFVVETILPLIEGYDLEIDVILATFIEHVAIQISRIVNDQIESGLFQDSSSVLITGGGAFNDFLIERIASYSEAELVIPNKDIIEFKEAIIFAFLGVLRDQNEINCLQSVTGAVKDHSSGMIITA